MEWLSTTTKDNKILTVLILFEGYDFGFFIRFVVNGCHHFLLWFCFQLFYLVLGRDSSFSWCNPVCGICGILVYSVHVTFAFYVVWSVIWVEMLMSSVGVGKSTSVTADGEPRSVVVEESKTDNFITVFRWILLFLCDFEVEEHIFFRFYCNHIL